MSAPWWIAVVVLVIAAAVVTDAARRVVTAHDALRAGLAEWSTIAAELRDGSYDSQRLGTRLGPDRIRPGEGDEGSDRADPGAIRRRGVDR